MKKLLGLLITAALVFASCEATLEPVTESGTGSICIFVSENVSRTLLPEISMDPARIDVVLDGPNGENREFSLENGEGSLTVTEAKYGVWSVRAQAYNEDNVLIGEGCVECTVHSGEMASVVLVLSPLKGEGSLALNAFWNVPDVEDPVFEAELTDGSGNRKTLDFVLDLQQGTASYCGELDNGYYALTLSLYDNDYLCTGAMEIVRIVKGEITSGSFDFTDLKINYGSIDVNIDMSLENPLTPIIGNKTDIIGLSEPLVLSASVEEEVSGVSYVWYVDGKAKSTDENYAFLCDAAGTYRIDLAAFSADGARAGSTGFSLYVSDQIQSYMKISEVQGASHVSPYKDQNVENVLGVITAVESKGFWMQSPVGDGDDATSEGIYVYTYSTHTQGVGDLVLVDGQVQEYGHDGALKLTELSYVTVKTLDTDYPLPGAVVIGRGGILPPEEYICNDSVYGGPFDPDEEGIDFFESLESMLVEIENPVVVGGTKYGEIPVIPEGVSYGSATSRGGLLLTEGNANPQRLHIDTDASILGLDPVEANLGDYFTETIQGVIGYNFGKFLILPTVLPALHSSPVVKEISGLAKDENSLTVATFNMENFPRDDEDMSPAEIEEKVEDMAETIVTGLGSPDILGIQEMTDDSYSEDDGTVTAQENAQWLIQKIVAKRGPRYEYVEIEPENKSEGGWEEANIRVAFLYNPARVGFTPAGNGGTFDETEVVLDEGGVSLTLNPGRFSLDSFADSRKSLLAVFEFRSEPVFIINNHLCSKGGDDYLFGENQPPVNSSETERHVQAEAVRAMVETILGADSGARVVVLGDMNDFQFSGTLGIIKEAGLESLTESLLEDKEQYSYIYNGNCQQLDHILVSHSLMKNARVDIVHRYAEYDSLARHTDHDPVVCSLSFEENADEGTLFFSEYAEGSSNNKYLEIYNPLSDDVTLDGYQVIRYNNGSTAPSGTYNLNGTLGAGDIITIMNSGADPAIVDLGDTTHTGATWYNGDDCMQLLDPSGTLIDQIGVLGMDPGTGWDVAGVTDGTKEHTLVRKISVNKGNGGDWSSSAGTNGDNSEWLVYGQDYWDNLNQLATE